MHFRVNAQKSMVVNKVATLLFWMMMMATDGCYMSEMLPSTALFVATFFSFKSGGQFFFNFSFFMQTTNLFTSH